MASLPFIYRMILIVASQLPPAEALADRFRSTGAHVIVTKSPASAVSLVRNAKVDLVFVSYMLQDPELMKVLKLRGVPYIICATPASMIDFAQSAGDAMRDQTQPTSSHRHETQSLAVSVSATSSKMANAPVPRAATPLPARR